MAPNFAVTAQGAAPVQTFAPGQSGMSYIADLYSGFILNADKEHTLFGFAQNDTSVTLASLLTNMRQPGRIGANMNFVAMQLGFRLVKLGTTPPTQTEIHDLIRYMASLKIEITVGDNETKIAEFSGAHILSPLTFATKEEFVTPTLAATAGNAVPFNQGGWINLPDAIALQNDLTLSGKVTSTLAAVPTGLYDSGDNFAFLAILAGRKQTK